MLNLGSWADDQAHSYTLINKSSTKSINRRWKKRCSTSKGGHVGFNPTFQLTGDQFSLSWISPLFFASCLVRDLLQVHSSRKSVVSMHEINGSLTFQRRVAGCWADFILKKNYNIHIMDLIICFNYWCMSIPNRSEVKSPLDKTALGEEFSL